MKKQGFLRLIFSWVLFLGMLLPPVVSGQNAPVAERQKIESLIKQVGDLKDAKFIRNGSTYEVSSAVRFLRDKWDANAAEVKSARDFIDKVASASSTSGKSYLIRFKNGHEIKSREFLLAELQKLDP